MSCCAGPTGPAGASPAGPGVPGATGPTGPPAALRTFLLSGPQTGTVAVNGSVAWPAPATQTGLPFVSLGADLVTLTFLSTGTYQLTVQLGVASTAKFQVLEDGTFQQKVIAWSGGTNAASIRVLLERTFFESFRAGQTLRVQNVGAAAVTMTAAVGASQLLLVKLA